MHFALIVLSGTLLMAQPPGFRPPQPANSVPVPACLVTLIDEIDVPAEVEGVLMEVTAVEGQQITEGELLVQLDDKHALVMEEVADYKLDVAKEEAGNDINERYAKAAAAVAENEYTRAKEANRIEPGTIPYLDLMRYWLQWEQAVLQIEQAQHDLGIAKTTVLVREAELKAAKHDVARRKINAPWDGVVEELYRRKGEWVRPGDPVLRLLRMDSLWIEGFVNAKRYKAADVRNRPVTVTIPLPGGETTFEGKIVFASAEIKGGDTFLVKAEVANRLEGGDWILQSGMPAQMEIELE